ncbi:MAG: Rpn family recombination-promoting nuclease/putative transposase [Armatimonadota bacterium]|nr:Rpn family recombination-promoting nuclease/putative transposase [Armatimonadota bacterium]
MDHDRLFKELLTTFFAEFLDLFLPEVSAYVDRDSFQFMDKEIFIDVNAGEKHEADIVVRARFRNEEAFFLVHVENQAKAQPNFNRRMFHYFARLHETHDLPIYPIVVFSYDAPQRPESDEYQVTFPDRTVLEFRFRVIQLNRLNWRDFLRSQNPVAAALMAKMHIAPEDRPRVKLECLRLLATLRLDPARTQLISGFVDSYLRLNAPERQVFDRELAAISPPEQEATMEIMTSWKEEGLLEGRQLGIGTTIQRQLRRRFGPLSEVTEARVSALPTERLEDLAEALLDFTTLTDLDVWLSHAGA